jgi:hypothetical protein
VRVPNRHPSGPPPRPGPRFHFIALGVLAAVTSIAPFAGAAGGDAPFDGKWRQGPLREDFTVQQWLPGCGPAPVSGAQGGGEIVAIHQEGDELSVVGGGRVYRTNQCYDQLPTLTREAHSRDPSGRAWRTRCATPAADPRRAMMQTLVSVTNDTHIDVVETGRYEISLAEGRCIADVKRSRDYDLVTRDGAQPVTPTPAPAPAATAPQPPAPRAGACETPGPPARLEVRPSRKLLRTGESFAFHAVVTDASGCVTGATTPIGWAIGAPLSVDATGKVTVPEGTAEGASTLVATAAGKSVRVVVDVTAPSHYDELLARSGLNAAGESESASVAELATGAIAGGDARATDTSRARRLTFITIVGLLALGLGVVAVVFGRKARRAARLEADADARHAELVREAEARQREKEATHAEQVRAHHESVEVHRRASEAAAAMDAEADVGTGEPLAEDARRVCPACRREYPPGSLFCPDDASRLVALRAGDDVAASGGICPACHRGFDPGVKVCPHDQEELVPYAMHAAAATRAPAAPVASRGKICPTCGGRFEGNAAFCGKDGTALVMLN